MYRLNIKYRFKTEEKIENPKEGTYIQRLLHQFDKNKAIGLGNSFSLKTKNE